MRGAEGFIEDYTPKKAGDLEDVDEVVKYLALALERRISELAPVDTGALRASVAAVRTEGELKTRADVAGRSDVDLNPEDFE